ncbi:MAG: hypothetical protein J1F68_01295 [Clostridiales bacterium]|nr:hypothetical protein [Clostridiales bacterium]
MIDENKPCLRLRNQTTRAEETYCKYYLKNFRGYIKHVFINFQAIGLFVMALAIVATITLVLPNLMEGDDDIMPWIIAYAFLFISVFFYIYFTVQKLWFWKYAKYVVVTNEGIWIMYYSTFWWGVDFRGKKHFWNPSWSYYTWNEIKITSDDSARPRSPVKLGNMEDDFDHAVTKSTQLTSLYLTRFDGVQQIHFLEEQDANEILAYAKEQQKRKKRKKKDMEIIVEEYDKIPDEYINDDEP